MKKCVQKPLGKSLQKQCLKSKIFKPLGLEKSLIFIKLYCIFNMSTDAKTYQKILQTNISRGIKNPSNAKNRVLDAIPKYIKKTTPKNIQTNSSMEPQGSPGTSKIDEK